MELIEYRVVQQVQRGTVESDRRDSIGEVLQLNEIGHGLSLRFSYL
jgi:hypothetical protein